MAYIALAVSALLVVIDQLIKWIVSTNMNLHDTISVWKIGDTEILNFSYYLNDGAAFSILEGKRWFLIGITAVAILAGIFLLVAKKVKRKRYVWSVAVIIAGGVGNLIDRVFNNGLVVDFIDFKIIKFAIFNFADICAVSGAIALLVFVICDEFIEIRDKKAKKISIETAENNALVNNGIAEKNTSVEDMKDLTMKSESSEKNEASDGENVDGAI